MANMFNLEALPVWFLDKLADYLNTKDLASLLMAMSRVDKIKDLHKTEVFRLFFKPKFVFLLIS